MLKLSTGSYSSRKFVLSLVALVLITGVTVCSIWSAAIQPILPTFIGGITGVLAVYLGGNVAAQHIQGKHEVAALEKLQPVDKPTDPEKPADKSAEYKEAEENP
jgi:hypothetical protein